MNIKIKIFFTILNLALIASCESIVDVDLPNLDSKIVVNCLFTPDSVWKVNISKSIGILEQFPTKTYESGSREKNIPEISTANVEVWETNTLITKLEYDKNGYYKSNNTFPELNENYTIKVDASDYKSVSASNLIPKPASINNIKLSQIAPNDYWGKSELTITIQDIPNIENYYELLILVKYDNSFSHLNSFVSDDVLLSEGVPIFDDARSFYGERALFDDVIFEGEEYSLKIKTDNIHESENSETFVILFTLSKDLYSYFKSIKTQSDADGNIFSEPAFINGNINGGLGIFGGYSSYYYKVE